jgi:hypothetical protein
VSPRGPSSGDDPPYSRTEYEEEEEEEERATAVWELRGAGVGPSATVTRTHTRRSVQHIPGSRQGLVPEGGKDSGLIVARCPFRVALNVILFCLHVHPY